MAGKMNNFTPYITDTFQIENKFDRLSSYLWMQQNWTLSFWYSFIYIILIIGGKHYMSKRPKYELRVPLTIWSSVLAVFSICGAIRTVPEMMFMLRVNGFEGSVCDPSCFTGPIWLWAHLFVISKVYELGDTAFIVLRKQPLIFLHWYHHVTVLIYTWYSYTEHPAVSRWFIFMNYVVHSFMYTYYALRAMKVRVPRVYSVFVTTLQITQMFIGIFVLVKAYQYKSQGHFCQNRMG